MVELKERNTRGPQLCFDEKHGTLLRTHSSKYFYVIGGHKADILELNMAAYEVLPSGSVPESMIRIDDRAADNFKTRCTGCGKLFKNSELDEGALCRGLDGCSAKSEIAEIRKERKRQEILERIRKMRGLR